MIGSSPEITRTFVPDLEPERAMRIVHPSNGISGGFYGTRTFVVAFGRANSRYHFALAVLRSLSRARIEVEKPRIHAGLFACRIGAQERLPVPSNVIIRCFALVSPLCGMTEAVAKSIQIIEFAMLFAEANGHANCYAIPAKFRSLRLSVRTPPFHGGESGSIPLGSATPPADR